MKKHPIKKEVLATTNNSDNNSETIISNNQYIFKLFSGVLNATLVTGLRSPFNNIYTNYLFAQNTGVTSIPPFSLAAPFYFQNLPSLFRSMRVNSTKSLATGNRKDLHDFAKEHADSEKLESTQRHEKNKYTLDNALQIYLPLLGAGTTLGLADTLMVSFIQNKQLLKKVNSSDEFAILDTFGFIERYKIYTRMAFVSNLTKNSSVAISLMCIDNLAKKDQRGLLSYPIITIPSAVLMSSFIGNLVDILQVNKAQCAKWDGCKIKTPSTYRVTKALYQTHGFAGLTCGLRWNIASTVAAFTAIEVLNALNQYIFVSNQHNQIVINEDFKQATQFITQRRDANQYFLSPHGLFYVRPDKPTLNYPAVPVRGYR